MPTTRRQFHIACSGLAAGALGAWQLSPKSVGGQDQEEAFKTTDLVDVAPPVAAEAAGAIGTRLQKRFAADAAAKPFRIAIFPFGGEAGKITLENQDVSFKAQGAFTHALGQALGKDHKGKFVILDKFALSRELREGGVDPAAVSAENTELPATLARLGIDLAILGSVKFESEGMVMRPSLVFAQAAGAGGGEAVFIPKPSGPAEENSHFSSQISKRFGLQIWQRRSGAFEPLPIVTSQNMESELANVLFAIVPAGSAGTEFVLRLSNQGDGPGPDDNVSVQNDDAALDRRRLFGVVLTIDGVNSFFEDLGDGEPKPAVMHPRNASKWLLSPPGFRIEPANNPSGFALVRSAGAGHSIVDVQGYQTDGKSARAFTFAPAAQSLAAEKVGISDEIGVIAAHFFAEKFPGDQKVYGSVQGTPQMGAAAGRQILQPVFKINPKFHKEPELTIKIFYRSAADCPIPRGEQLVVSGRR